MMSRLLLVIAIAVVGLTACQHRAVDLGDPNLSYRSPRHRANHPGYGPVAVRNVVDKRPSRELGQVNYLKESFYSESLFTRSVPSTLKRLVGAELVASGAFSAATDATSARYVVDIVIYHFFTRADRGLLGLIPVIPDVEVEGRVDLGFTLLDQDGRRFLDRRFDVRKEARVATVSDVEGTGGDLLMEALSEVMRDVVESSDASIPAFWRELGLPIP